MRVAVEHDERAFDLAEVIDLAKTTGARAIFDMHHHRCNRAPSLYEHADAMRAAFATWPAEQRPNVHLSSPRTELRSVKRGVVVVRDLRRKKNYTVRAGKHRLVKAPR